MPKFTTKTEVPSTSSSSSTSSSNNTGTAGGGTTYTSKLVLNRFAKIRPELIHLLEQTRQWLLKRIADKVKTMTKCWGEYAFFNNMVKVSV